MMNECAPGQPEISKWISLLAILFVATIATPKVPLFGVDAAYSVLRLDTAISIVFSLLSVIYLLAHKTRTALLVLSLFLLYAGMLNEAVQFPAALIAAIYASSFFASLLVSLELGAVCNRIKFGDYTLLDVVLFFLILNSASGLASLLSGYSYCVGVSYADVESSRCLFDRYGYTGAPYIFGAYAVALLCVASLKRGLVLISLGLVSLVLSDSRSYFIAFFPLALYFVLKGRLGWKGYILGLASLAALPFIETKAVAGAAIEQLGDDSFGMRLMIFDEFLSWLDSVKLAIGGGANAFFEFATQYGMPGHPDNLYVRLISEVGLLGAMIMLAALILRSRAKLKLSQSKPYLALLFSLGLLLLGLGQEAMLAVKSGQILLFSLGLLSGLATNGFSRWHRQKRRQTGERRTPPAYIGSVVREPGGL